jgi:hypothetical protein
VSWQCHFIYIRTSGRQDPFLQAGALRVETPTSFPSITHPLLEYLRQLKPGKWQKVIKYGDRGEVHYIEHESGDVADVKFFPYD